MEHVDYTKLYDKHAAEFAAAADFAEFIRAIAVSDNERAFYLKYAGGWADRSFLTHKTHGFVGRPLAMPTVTTWSGLFEKVELLPYLEGGRTYYERHDTEQKNRLFISGATRSKGLVHFGEMSAPLYIKTRKDGRFFCFGVRSRGRYTCSYATPTKSLRLALFNNLISDRWFSVEIVERNDGKILITGKDGHYIGSIWLALLDRETAGPSPIEMLPETDQQQIRDYRAYQESVYSCVDQAAETVDFEKAAALNIEIVKDRF